MKPISAGDRCLVVGGLGQSKSPNIGLTVTVQSFQGEHSGRGRIFRCTGQGIKQLTDTGAYVETNEADFAVSWLQRIDPIQTKKEKSRELQATS
jgi:hypothetical protein